MHLVNDEVSFASVKLADIKLVANNAASGKVKVHTRTSKVGSRGRRIHPLADTLDQNFQEKLLILFRSENKADVWRPHASAKQSDQKNRKQLDRTVTAWGSIIIKVDV